MAHIVLTDEQARIVSEAQQDVEVRDPQGKPLAFIRPLPPEEAALIAEARRRLQTPEQGVASARVMNMMAQLQDLDGKGEATPEAIKAVVQSVLERGQQ